MVSKTYVTINDVNVSSYIVEWVVEDELEDVMTIATIKLLKTVIDVVSPTHGHEIIIKRGISTGQENLMFRGLIEGKKLVHPTIELNAKDYLYALKKEEITNSFDKNIDTEAGVPSEIFLTLVNTYSSIAANSTTVQNSLTLEPGIILNKFVCNHDSIFDRCKFIADVLDWQFYYKPTDHLVYLEPRGYTNYGTTLVTGVHIIGDVPEWEFDNSMCINKLTVLGARQLIETTETFDGDTTETEFQLTKIPESIKVYVDDVLQTGGLERSTSTYDYTVDINPTVRKVIFESGSIPGTGTDNVEVRYSYSVPVPVANENEESQTKYGIYEKTLVYEDIKSVDDAEERARQTIAKYSIPFASTQLKVIGVTDIKAGYLVGVQDDINGESRTLLASKVKYSYPFTGDEITLSDKEWRLAAWLTNIEERLKKIERENTRNQDYLVNLRDFNHLMDYNKRYTYLYTRDTSTDVIWGRFTWEASNWDGTYDNSLALARIVWPDEVYKETFFDTDFKDASATTANWDTTLNRCSIS